MFQGFRQVGSPRAVPLGGRRGFVGTIPAGDRGWAVTLPFSPLAPSTGTLLLKGSKDYLRKQERDEYLEKLLGWWVPTCLANKAPWGNGGWEPNSKQLLQVMGYWYLTVCRVFILAKDRIREIVSQYYSYNSFCKARMFPISEIYTAYLHRCCLFSSGKSSTLNLPRGWKITQTLYASNAQAIMKYFLLFKAH